MGKREGKDLRRIPFQTHARDKERKREEVGGRERGGRRGGGGGEGGGGT